jgi:hypothetical protein
MRLVRSRIVAALVLAILIFGSLGTSANAGHVQINNSFPDDPWPGLGSTSFPEAAWPNILLPTSSFPEDPWPGLSN